jgi:hypothetical protein
MQEQQRAQALQQTLQQAAQRQQQARQQLQQQGQQQQGQQLAQEGQQPVQQEGVGERRFVMLRRQGVGEDMQVVMGEGPSGAAQALGQQQEQQWPRMARCFSNAWTPAGAASAQEQKPHQWLAFPPDNVPGAAAERQAGYRPPAAAAGSSSTPPAAAGETPWASSGSQPGTTLEQHLAGPSTGTGAAALGSDSPSAAAGNPQSWRPPLRGYGAPPVRRGEEYYRQFPGGDPEVARMISEFKLDEVDPSGVGGRTPATNPLMTPVCGAPGEGIFSTGPPTRAPPRAGRPAAAMERQAAADLSGSPRQPRRRGEVDVEAAVAAMAGTTGIGRWRQHGDEGDAPLTAYMLNRPAAHRQPMRQQCAAAGPGQVPADDAESSDSQHSSHEDPAADPQAQPAAAAGGAAGASIAPGSAAAAAAAAEADEADETPSSAADTECASDTSSEAEGVLTPTVAPNDKGGLSDQPAAAQHLALAGRQFSSAGGSGSSSSGGGAAAATGAAGSSGGGASSSGGSSSGGPVRQVAAPRDSRLQPPAPGADGPPAAAAAAGEGCEGLDSGVECFRDPPASDGDCREPAAAGGSGQAPAAEEGQADAGDEAGAAAPQGQEGRSAGYFPFNVLQAAWWGN